MRNIDHGLLLIHAALLALIVAIGVAARPAYRAYREYRINSNLEAAKTAARHEDWSKSRDYARSVLLVRPDFEAYRIWARALGKLGAPSTYMAAAEIFTDPRATRDDLLESLQVMAVQAPHAVALSAYASLPPTFHDQASFRAAIVPLLIQRGQIDLAEKSLREVFKPTDDPKVKLELLRTLCSRPQAARVAEARRIFADLIESKADAESLAALLILGDTPGGLTADKPLPDLPKWLKDQPRATTLHHLLGMHPALKAMPETAPRLYDTAIKRFLAIDPGVLGTWLTRHEQAEMTVSILEEPAKTRSDAYIARLQALLRLKQDAKLIAALNSPPPSADLVEIEIVQAYLAARNGDMIASSAAWTRALNHAAYDTTRNRCLEIARAAEKAGAKDAAEDAWVAAVRLGWGQLPLYNDLLPIFASLVYKGRSEDLLPMLRTLLRFEPRNQELLHNAYYFALIQGTLPPDQAVKMLTKLIEQHDKPVYHSSLMLAEMLDGRPADALARLPRFRDGKSVAPDMLAALEGTVRILVGETEAGTALLKAVNWSNLMGQERIVFRNLLIKFNNAKLPLPELINPSVAVDPDQLPAWRKAVERFEKDRAGDVLPALEPPKIAGSNQPDATLDVDPASVPAWRKAIEKLAKDRTNETLPALPQPHIPGSSPPVIPATTEE